MNVIRLDLHTATQSVSRPGAWAEASADAVVGTGRTQARGLTLAYGPRWALMEVLRYRTTACGTLGTE